MMPSEELFEQIKSTSGPDKDRILKTRALALHLATFIDDRTLARKLVRELNMAYLHLQFATLSEFAGVKSKFREQCLEAATQLCAASNYGGTRQGGPTHGQTQRDDDSAGNRAGGGRAGASLGE